MPDISVMDKPTNTMRGNMSQSIAPSIVGYYALTIATFLMAVGFARGNPALPYQDFVSSAAILFSGLTVLLSARWAYMGRDTLSMAIFGVWGSFFLAYGALYIVSPRADLALLLGPSTSLGFWMTPLAVVTWTMAIAAIRVNYATFAFLVLLGFGAAIAAVGFFSDISAVMIASGWVMILSSLAALWTASSLLFEAVMGYSPLPLFRRERAVPAAEAEEHLIIEGR